MTSGSEERAAVHRWSSECRREADWAARKLTLPEGGPVCQPLRGDGHGVERGGPSRRARSAPDSPRLTFAAG